MDLVADEGAQALVDKLMTRDRPQTVESISDDDRLKMCIVIAHHRGGGVLEARLDESLDFAGFHCGAIT